MDTSPRHILVAAAVVININNEILLINSSKRGWEIPAGRVEEGESLSAAVIRETKQETGIDIEIVRFCGVFQNVQDSVCSTLFQVRPVGGEFRTSDESYEIGYYSIDEALSKITWRGFKEQLEYCLNQTEPFLYEYNN